jgi:hypothetical protein
VAEERRIVWIQRWRDRATERIVTLREVDPRSFEVVEGERVLCRFSNQDVAENWLLREGYEDVTELLGSPDDKG